MRIAFTVPNFWPRVTGPGLVCHVLADRLGRAGHECRIYTYDQGDEWGQAGGAPELSDGVEVVRFRRGASWPFLLPPGLRDDLDGFRPDVVFVHEVRNGLQSGAVRWASRRGVRTAVQPHGGLTSPFRLPGVLHRAPYRVHDAIAMRSLRSADAWLVAGCKAEEDDLVARGWDSARVLRLYLGSDFAPAGASIRRDGSPRILMAGNLGTFRDPNAFVEAVRALQAGGVDLDARVAGRFQRQSIFFKPKRPADWAPAWYEGPYRPDEVPRLLAECDVFCYPTRYESFGLPVLEAALAGVPVVTTPFGIARELGLEDGAGVLVDRPTSSDLAKGLERVLDDLDGFVAAARRRAPRLGEWAAWERRAPAYQAWIEDASYTPEPGPGEWVN